MRFHDEVSWAFKMFDVDNSGSIVVEEIHESVKVFTCSSRYWMQFIMFWVSDTNLSPVWNECELQPGNHVEKSSYLKAVWKILDGIGDAIQGTAEEISEFIFSKLKSHGKQEVR